MPVTFTDNSRQVQDRYRNASRYALDAAAQALVVRIKQAHGDWYYKGGKHRTGQVKQSIKRKMPEWTPTGWLSQVGTKLMFPLYWELGFTPKYRVGKAGSYSYRYGTRQRVRIWVPAALRSRAEIVAEFGKTLKRYMEKP